MGDMEVCMGKSFIHGGFSIAIPLEIRNWLKWHFFVVWKQGVMPKIHVLNLSPPEKKKKKKKNSVFFFMGCLMGYDSIISLISGEKWKTAGAPSNMFWVVSSLHMFPATWQMIEVPIWATYGLSSPAQAWICWPRTSRIFDPKVRGFPRK